MCYDKRLGSRVSRYRLSGSFERSDVRTSKVAPRCAIATRGRSSRTS